MRSACAELCLKTEGFRERLSWKLDGGSVEVIESHREALLSEVERIEGAAAQEKLRRKDGTSTRSRT